MARILAIDTECCGLDLYHNARPFAVTTCDENGEQLFYEWDVCPYSRQVDIPQDDIDSIRKLIDTSDRLIFHNGKFDITALESIGVFPSSEFPWEKVDDTIIAHHCLYSAYKHSLDKIVLQYFREDINYLEKDLEIAVQECRRLTRTKKFRENIGEWKIAVPTPEFRKHSPSTGDKQAWRADYWLPLAIARALEYPPDHSYYTVLEKYANPDSKWTLDCWFKIEAELRRKGYWAIYRARMGTIPVAQAMEREAVTGSLRRAEEFEQRISKERKKRVFDCVSFAKQQGYSLSLPKSGNNANLVDFVFNHLKLPVVKRTENGSPSLDKDVFDIYEKELPHNTVGYKFIQLIMKKRRIDTALSYLEGYKRFWIPTGIKNEKGEELYFRLHPNLNPTGTVQLRWSSNNPNSQNISKQEGYNLRYIFGPEDGWEWWSLDYQNVELRIPTFKAKEQKLMDVFLRPKDPPYFGSYHLVVFDALHPQLFKKHGVAVKDLFESTLYQWVKNGNFGMIYGCGRKKANATYHMEGAYDIVRDSFPNIAKLSDMKIEEARKYGFVQTVPDSSVDSERGFPIMAGRTNDGGILPTTPLNYFVSGSAMWVTGRSMVRTHNQLKEWLHRPARNMKAIDGRIVMQIHDELVFAFPKSKFHPKEDLDNEKKFGGPCIQLNGSIDINAYKSNLGRVRVLQRLMEESGEFIGVPTPVGVEYNSKDWATCEKF